MTWLFFFFLLFWAGELRLDGKLVGRIVVLLQFVWIAGLLLTLPFLNFRIDKRYVNNSPKSDEQRIFHRTYICGQTWYIGFEWNFNKLVASSVDVSMLKSLPWICPMFFNKDYFFNQFFVILPSNGYDAFFLIIWFI